MPMLEAKLLRRAPRRPHGFVSLRRKLITGIVLAIAVVSLGRGLLEISVQGARINRDIEDKSGRLTLLAADLAAAPLVYGDDKAIRSAMSSLMLDDDIAYIQILDSVGNIRCELGTRHTGMLMKSRDIVYRTSYPIGLVNLGVGVSKERIMQARLEVVWFSLASFIITLFLIVLLVLVITHLVMRPMETLKDTVGRLSRGDYSARSHVNTNDEVGVLSRFIDDSIELIRQREEHLRQSENRYRLLADNATDTISTCNLSGVLTYLSPSVERLTGYRPEQLLGKSIFGIVHPLDRKDFQKLYGAPHAIGDHFTSVYRIHRKDGSVAWLETTNQVVSNSNGEMEMQSATREISDSVEAQQQLLGEKERLRITLESIGDGVIATDSQGIVTLMNDVAATYTGWPVAQAVGQPLSQVFDIYNEATGEPAMNPVEKVLQTGAVVELANHTVLRAQDGTLRYIADSAAPILDGSRDILGVVMVVRDVSEQKHKEKVQIYQSYHDVLTGLYNRSFFEEEMKRLDSGRQMPISIIMGDVNGLKLTNDVFGHDEGDTLLRRIAALLSSCCRADDIVARTGGDEFCILLPSTEAEGAEEICQRIYNACSEQDVGNGAAALRLSISLGYATKESAERRLPSVLKAAEDSMYKRKLLESRGQHSSIVSSIRSTLSEKSHETEDHSYRLMNYARMVGMKAMLNSDQLSDLELLALMHDIGKITVDDAILNKSGPLTKAEWEVLKKHPEMGYRIASSSPELLAIANCILAHHERWDGKGYPQGLSGADIPLLSRILSIVDSYDAMTQDRVYRKGLTREQAMEELRRNTGTQFDPELVDIFIQCIEETNNENGWLKTSDIVSPAALLRLGDSEDLHVL